MGLLTRLFRCLHPALELVAALSEHHLADESCQRELIVDARLAGGNQAGQFLLGKGEQPDRCVERKVDQTTHRIVAVSH